MARRFLKITKKIFSCPLGNMLWTVATTYLSLGRGTAVLMTVDLSDIYEQFEEKAKKIEN